jgi:hypothetical protein
MGEEQGNGDHDARPIRGFHVHDHESGAGDQSQKRRNRERTTAAVFSMNIAQSFRQSRCAPSGLAVVDTDDVAAETFELGDRLFQVQLLPSPENSASTTVTGTRTWTFLSVLAIVDLDQISRPGAGWRPFRPSSNGDQLGRGAPELVPHAPKFLTSRSSSMIRVIRRRPRSSGGGLSAI